MFRVLTSHRPLAHLNDIVNLFTPDRVIAGANVAVGLPKSALL